MHLSLEQILDAPLFWVPFQPVEEEVRKAEDGSACTCGKIRGIASSEEEDDDGETIVQKGIDWSPLLRAGAFHAEHPNMGLNKIGEPTAIRETTLANGTPATEVEGVLFLDDKLGKVYWEKSVSLKKAGARLGLGMSVEGRIRERDGKNRKRITKAIVSSIAISGRPKNRNAYFEPLMQSAFGKALIAAMGDDGLMRADYPFMGGGIEAAPGLAPLAAQSIEKILQSASAPAIGRPMVSRDMADEEIFGRMKREFPGLDDRMGWKIVDILRGRN